MQEFIELCLEEAKKGLQREEVPVGCVIVKSGRVIARAHNRVEETGDPTAHAEIIAIKEATKLLKSKYLYGCELYVSLEPCPMCAYALVLARVEKLIFLAKDEKYGAVMSLYSLLDEPTFNHEVSWEYVPVEEASQLLKSFFRKRRKV
ncbi:MAG: nucleoside deaminase [Aquificaceae bacterium]|nr:nucleoside deaminase [Aquificaceae bacterium]MDW8294162.1 nucleoside deaminase [Aquificaceae bacterium]